MKIIGHRGAAGLAAENTINSFKKALECGVDAIELDVHLTSDGQLVCNHNPEITANDGKPWLIAQHALAELLVIKPDLTTLPQAIETIDRQVTLIIEIKTGVPAQPVIDCIKSYLDKGWLHSDFEFCSFEQAPLLAVHQALPACQLIPNESWSSLRVRRRARQLGSKRVALKQKWLWRGFLRMMQQHGWLVSAYTVNDAERARKWQPYLYGVYTDRPDLIHK